MRLLDCARSRLGAFLDEMDRVGESEFSTPHSKLALDQLRERFSRELQALNDLDEHNDPDAVSQKSSFLLADLFNYLPLIGFILRSTNVRNAFEEFGPLLRLAGSVLEPKILPRARKTRLILSSEWNYSPLSYHNVAHLPGFVLIGFPAPESANPLLVPLAGHELGHSIWMQQNLSNAILASAKEKVIAACKARWAEFQRVFPLMKAVKPEDIPIDIEAIEQWSPAVPLALAQAEETFCDFIGVKLFATSYLQAFAYLLSPKAGPRSIKYPSMKKRIENQREAATVFGVTVPDGYVSLFEDNQAAGLTEGDRLRVAIADEALVALVPDLIVMANMSIDQDVVQLTVESEIERILERVHRGIPAEHTKSIIDIMNAAWRASEEPDLWKDIPRLAAERELILKELVLKNLEVFEIEQILGEPE